MPVPKYRCPSCINALASKGTGILFIEEPSDKTNFLHILEKGARVEERACCNFLFCYSAKRSVEEAAFLLRQTGYFKWIIEILR